MSNAEATGVAANGARYAQLVGVVATLAYCLAAWFISGIWSTLVPDQDSVSRLAVIAIRPLPLSMEYAMLHWQLLAVFSLIAHCFWGARRAALIGEGGYALPLLCHYGWLFSALCLHLAGALAGFVSVVYKI